jgi:hypothetical protein
MRRMPRRSIGLSLVNPDGVGTVDRGRLRLAFVDRAGVVASWGWSGKRADLMLSPAGCVVALAVSGAVAQTVVDDRSLLAGDAAPGDQLGTAVGVCGGLAIAGAPLADPGGSRSGAAYVFDVVTGAQALKLIPGDSSAFDRFGNAVAIWGSTAIVGAAENDDAGTDSGSAYLFNALSGQQVRKLLAGDGRSFDNFGFSVSIGADRAIVGAPGDDDLGESSGSAYVFAVPSGARLFKVTPGDVGPADSFGFSVSIGAGRAVVGAPGGDDPIAGDNAGAAYVVDTATGALVTRLSPDLPVGGSFFGIAVAMDGAHIVVGASFEDDSRGAAYVFDAATGQEVHRLVAPDGMPDDLFGLSVAVSGRFVVVGSPGDALAGGGSGSAHVFDVVTGERLASVVPGGAGVVREFASTVGVSGAVAVAGARFSGGLNEGSVRVLDVPCAGADLAVPRGSLTFADVAAFVSAFASGDPASDFAVPFGELTFADVGGFLGSFDAGCP